MAAASQEQKRSSHLFKKHERSVGLRVVDALIYPIINNVGVFALSVGLTYMSKHGADVDQKTGKLVFGKIGELIHKRTSPVFNLFKRMHCSDESAKNYTVVAFSFIDGTVFAPMVKFLEDRRERIAHWIDDRLGTTKDESVYEAEPKQSWGSVLQGRIATSAIVVPTALFLDKKGLNSKMFDGYGNKLAEAIESSPKIRKLFSPKLNMPKLSNIMVFEAFYTSVCTAGLYFISRFIASKHPAKHPHEEIVGDKVVVVSNHAHSANTITSKQVASDPGQSAATEAPMKQESPETKISTATHIKRVAEPEHTVELTA